MVRLKAGNKMSVNDYEKRPVVVSDLLGRDYAENCVSDHKKQFGQYLTPVAVADYMGNLISRRKKDAITILDPGVGTGILTCAACEKAIHKIDGLKKINIIGYEIDKNILSYTYKSLDYLKEWLKRKNIDCDYKIITKDFIIDNSNAINNENLLFDEHPSIQNADVVISNPPYFKINKDDPRAVAVSKVVHGQPNIYSLFMAVSAYLINKDGDLIFITPRSYTSGYYFRSFRDVFFSEIIPKEFHLFGSRKEAFERDDVLQEHLIIHGKKKPKHKNKSSQKVAISFSNSSIDLDKPIKRKAYLNDVVNYNSKNKFIFLPLSDEEENIISLVNSWPGSLHKYDMEISTGKVVPFRARPLLKKQVDKFNDYAPLVWMNHIKAAQVDWPLENWRKEQFITVNSYSLPILVPNNNYILMRRFSPKEDKKRINTAPLLKTQFDFEFLGIENHVNYVHRPNGELSLAEVYGLSAIFNSRYLDLYFRTLNGNTEVSSTEIRDIPLPDYDLICEIGHEILKKGTQSINVENYIEIRKAGAA